MKIYSFAYNSKIAWLAKLKFGHNVGAYECFMPGVGKLVQRKSRLRKTINTSKLQIGLHKIT